ncbi:MAG: hypothetical protein ABMA64_04825 [Myxococcota bacterium]
MTPTLWLTWWLAPGCAEDRDRAGPQLEEADTDTDTDTDTDADTDADTDLDGTEGAVQDLIAEVADELPGWADASDRLVTAYVEGAADGVTLGPEGPVRSGTVDADLDGDGARETRMDVTLWTEVPSELVQVSLYVGAPGSDEERSLDGWLQVDGDATRFGSVSVYARSPAVTFVGDSGEVGLTAPAPDSRIGTMAFTAYTAEVDSTITGVLEVWAEADGSVDAVTTFSTGRRAFAGVSSIELWEGCSYAVCAVGPHGVSPGPFVAALLALVRRRRG